MAIAGAGREGVANPGIPEFFSVDPRSRKLMDGDELVDFHRSDLGSNIPVGVRISVGATKFPNDSH